jgi:hypothetical protein
MKAKEIGACNAILSGISTKIDGSIKITLELNPDEHKIISELLKKYALNEKLLQVGFVAVSND